MATSGCINDDSIGPSVQGCRGDFDFTLKFERLFLELLPSAIFAVLSLVRAWFLVRKPVIASGTWFKFLKLSAVVFYAFVQLCMLVLGSVQFNSLRVLTIAANTCSLAAACIMVALTVLEHSRSPRPSILINSYLIVTILLDIAACRTLWAVAVGSIDDAHARLAVIAIASKAVLILLESRHKSRWLYWPPDEHSPEETAGIFGLGALLWLNRLFLTGYRKIMTLDDLYPLDSAIAAEKLCDKLQESFGPLQGPHAKYYLVKTLARTLIGPLLLPVGPRVAMSAFRLSQPFLIKALLGYMQEPADERRLSVGYGLIGAAALIYTGLAVSGSLFRYLHERTICMTRGALASIIYRKTTQCKISAADDSAPLTLMSTDLERVRMGLIGIHEYWATPIEVGIAFWLLQGRMGPAFASLLVPIFFCGAAITVLGASLGRRQRGWMERVQRRVGLTANVINHMKHLKISGLTAPVEALIQQLRVAELAVGGSFRLVQMIVVVLGFTPRVLGPVIVFAFTNVTLDTQTVYTSFSFMLLITAPMLDLFLSFPPLIATLTCVGRIQDFLGRDNRIDFRCLSIPATSCTEQESKQPGSHFESQKDGPEDGKAPRSAINICKGSFGWDASPSALKGIDLAIPASKLTIVVGPVASGKTTLCKTLLGETPVFSGETYIENPDRPIGYCDQEPFMSNASIRDNILGFSPFDASRYREVLEAAMLTLDLSILPKGDQTQIGSNGIQLSGGQRQRVSIARALYLPTDLLIFDDVLSGLDSDTEEHVFQRVFGPDGLVRRRGATAVLCTHSVRHLPMADHVVALGRDGTILEQGSFAELSKNKKYVQSLGVSESVEDAISSSAAKPFEAEVRPRAHSTIPHPRLGGVPERSATSSSHVPELERKTGDKTVYRHYFATLEIRKIAGFFVYGVLMGFLFNWGTIWLQYMSTDVVSASPKYTKAFYIGMFGAFQVFCMLTLFGLGYICLVSMLKTSGAKLHASALRTMVGAPLRFFTRTDAGTITNIFSQDMTIIDGELPMAMANLTINGWTTIGMVAVVATASPYLVATYLPIAAVLYCIQRFYLRTSRQLRLLDIESRAPLYTHYLDTIKGLATFRAFGWVGGGLGLNDRLVDSTQRPAYLLAMIQHWLASSLALIVMVIAVIVVALATLVSSSSYSGLTGASLLMIMSLGESLSNLIRNYTALETSIGAVTRLRAFCERVKPESQEGEDFFPPEQWPENGSIKIRDVSASYSSEGIISEGKSGDLDGASDGKPDLALNGISISIRPGEKVAICGRSGSGKSSTMLLLLRLLDPLPLSGSSSIEIDGTPLQKIDRQTLRQRLIAVPQDPVFLPDGSTFQANLDPFAVATTAECRSVLEAVELWSFVEQRGGLASPMSSDTLSQGQKQLFSLARAILRKRVRSRQQQQQAAPAAIPDVEGSGGSISNSAAAVAEKCEEKQGGRGILLLDEVSSSVDQATDRAMQGIIKREFAGYTIVMVSHRLDMVAEFDTVVMMDRGRVVETGCPRELLARPGGSRFRDLWQVVNRG